MRICIRTDQIHVARISEAETGLHFVRMEFDGDHVAEFYPTEQTEEALDRLWQSLHLPPAPLPDELRFDY